MTEKWRAAPSHHQRPKQPVSMIEPISPTTTRKATKKAPAKYLVRICLLNHLQKITIIMTTLEEQVRNAIEQARRDKEKAYHEQKLAQQRLRLVREEYDAAVATEKAAYENLQTTQEKSGGEETSKALAALKVVVDQLEKDVRRNHEQ
jgi:F0F1-type ATP synthase membrane subunit b/b'